MHIDLKICHFLQLIVSITEAGKSKNKGKTGIHGPSPYRASITEQFFCTGCEKNWQKMTFFGASYGNWHFIYLRLETQKEGIFDHFEGYHVKQKLF